MRKTSPVNSPFLLAGWLAVQLVMAGPAHASFISLECQSDFDVRDDVLAGALVIGNDGDEAAHNLQASVTGAGFSWSSPVRASLEPRGRYRVELRQKLGRPRPGRYPVLVKIAYTDANRYPFTALSATLYSIGEAQPPGIWAIMDKTRIRREGDLAIRLKNIDDGEKSLQARLLLPNELSSTPLSAAETLRANEEASLKFKVSNFSALPGSSYPIYAVIEYDDARGHQALLAQSSVEVLAATASRSARAALIAAAALLAAALVFWNVRAIRRK
ncbi:MAG TPA: hypothetical protein DEB40_00580 [Elusimicrobia bacterium]|nr:hypothetical protein [Elusimicrobiota bacterium]HBT60223.1 hypothetical protein [Elusimicrobiota bacterium]